MTRFAVLALMLAASPALAQEQQAGNDASTNTDETFQALIDKCDDTDALMLRARIRLQLPRTTDEAAATAQQMLDEAFATCGEGDLDGAKEKLTEALAVAEAGATENFGTDAATDETETAEADTTEVDAKTETVAADADNTTEDAADDKPWWKFW
ncbi:MAG: hypothetical protein AAGF74_04200 [Pseudomonadota bacterium]